MKRIKSKLSIAVIALAVIVLIAGIGAYAYWSVSQQLAGNSIASGHMSISVLDFGGSQLTSLNVSGLMPGLPLETNKRVYTVTSAVDNPATDLYFSIPSVSGNGTLKDNVRVAFALMTGNPYGYWLTPSGAEQFTIGSVNTEATYSAHAYNMSEYAGKSWGDLAGYTDLAPSDIRHVQVFYYLPVDCSEDCHDSDVTFEMLFELEQSH